MLVTISALIVSAMPALFQSALTSDAASAASPVHSSLTSRDSARVLRLARDAQSDFETQRRRFLPYEALGGGGGCDAAFGRYCYAPQYATPPREAPQIVIARTRLLATLDSIGTLVPGDRWVLGQRVRYLMEAGRPFAADSAAVACAANSQDAPTQSWCLALVGYTAQQLGSYPRAEAAFAMAFEHMPESERCKWQDLGLLLGRSATGPYRRVDCQARDSVTAAFWRLVQPLYLSSVNDLRTEFLARVTRMYIEEGTKTPMSDWWGASEREALLRYGVPAWYSQGQLARGETRPRVAGFHREPSFNFFPDAHAFASPDQLAADDWDYLNLDNTPTYAPLWTVSFLPLLNHQVALFRRGDSAFIVAAFDVDGVPRGDTRQVGVFAALVDRGGVLTPFGATMRPTGLGVVSTLVAPWRPLVISLEALDSAHGVAERVRFAPKLPVSGSRLSLSDLLLYTPQEPSPTSLTAVMPRVLHALRVPSNRQVGVFWETYGVRPQGESLDYTFLVTPDDESFMHRALVKLHVTEPDRSFSLEWHETMSAANGIASRGVTVDLSHLRPGRYSMRLMLTSGTDLPIVAERIIEIL